MFSQEGWLAPAFLNQLFLTCASEIPIQVYEVEAGGKPPFLTEQYLHYLPDRAVPGTGQHSGRKESLGKADERLRVEADKNDADK